MCFKSLNLPCLERWLLTNWHCTLENVLIHMTLSMSSCTVRVCNAASLRVKSLVKMMFRICPDKTSDSLCYTTLDEGACVLLELSEIFDGLLLLFLSQDNFNALTEAGMSLLELHSYKQVNTLFPWVQRLNIDSLVLDLKVEVSTEPVVEDGLLNVAGGL